MFTIPPNLDPVLKRTLTDIQGILYKLTKSGRVTQQVSSSTIVLAQKAGDEPKATPQELSGDTTLHGNLFVDGSIKGGTHTHNVTVAASDVTGSRAVGTVYQNTGAMAKLCIISVTLSA
jgi:hypothetical protein